MEEVTVNFDEFLESTKTKPSDHIDFLGQQLSIGDRVVFSSDGSSSLDIGFIENFTATMAVIRETYSDGRPYTWTTKRGLDRVLKINKV